MVPEATAHRRGSAAPSSSRAEVERCGPREPSWSYAQKRYAPPVPSAGKLRSASLLFSTFERAGAEELGALCDAAREEFGLDRSVWSVKLPRTGATSWELYWYDHSDDVPLTLERVRRVVEPHLGWPDLPFGHDRRLWSVSVDLRAGMAAGERVGDVHLYAPRPSVPATCASYRLSPAGLELENTYFLYTGPDQRELALEWSATSLLGPDALGSLLSADHFPCDHVAVAHKPRTDGVYLGGLPARRSAEFLRRAGAPAWASDLLDRADDELDHLLVDVGADVAPDPAGVGSVVKCAFHGVV